MKNKLEYILKHNNAAQGAYKTIMGGLFRAAGRVVPIDDKLVLFSSFSGKRYDDSPRVIFEEMRRRKECEGFTFVWAFNSPDDFDVEGAQKVKMDSLAYFNVALRAKYWVTNVNIERGLSFKKPETRYLNTWHGTPIKTIGNAVEGRSDYDFSYVDVITADGAYFKERMVKDFKANPDSVLCCGRPCDDRLFDDCFRGDREAAKRSLGIDPSAKVILYAPTWRESTDAGSSYSFAPPIHFEQWKKELGEDVVILFRAHSIMSEVLGLVFDEKVIDVSNHPDVNDLMLASDVLVSDYSGIMFDYSILGRPIVCYCYDYEEYSSLRGMYFDVRDYLTSVSSEDALLECLKVMDVEEEERKAVRFFETFAGYGGNGTKECVDALLRAAD